MKTYFQEKQISITDADGEKLELFMRPLKIKELQIIQRVSKLAESEDSDEFTTPLLLSLVIDCLSINGHLVPVDATEDLINTFIEYNFPDTKKKFEESDRSATKKKTEKVTEPLSFFIDFLVNQGHTVSDIMEMTMPQFNELIMKAGERLSPSTKKMDPLVAFRKMGIPIRNRGRNNGR
jgi:hypothetical protein